MPGYDLLFKCTKCGNLYNRPAPRCSKCNGVIRYAYDELEWRVNPNERSMWRYEGLLPAPLVAHRVTLGEGLTPLVRASRLFKGINAFLKDETRNPTSSFRDRAASMVVTHALLRGERSVVCATDGNMGAAVAAYSARTGIGALIVVPVYVDTGRLAQMAAYGAKIVEHGVSIDDSIREARRLEVEEGYYQATAELNALSIEGLKTIAFEVVEELGDVDHVVVPTGSGLTAFSLYEGFRELVGLEMISDVPSIHVVQSEEVHPVVDALRGATRGEPARALKPAIWGLDVYEPLYLDAVVNAVKRTKGSAVAVSVEDSVKAVKDLAASEGLFVEPAAGASVAGAKLLVEEGVILPSETTVILLTGSGLKAVDYLAQLAPRRRLRNEGLTSKALILRVLRDHGPLHGYALWRSLPYRMTLQAVYQHLRSLERRGLVRSEVMGRRKIYAITSKGLALLESLEKFTKA